MMLDMLAHFNWERPVYFVSPSRSTNLGLQNYLQLEGFAYRLVPIETQARDQVDAGRVASEIMYENLMEEFEWGNFNDPGVYTDYTSRRTANVIRIRNKFARLANKLIREGENEKAIGVLDRGMEITPHGQLPYGIWVLEVVEGYYKAGATQKANDLAEELAGITENELSYYFSLQEPFGSLITNSKRLELHIMHRLSQITGEYGQEELSNKYEDIVNENIGSLRGNIR